MPTNTDIFAFIVLHLKKEPRIYWHILLKYLHSHFHK